MGKSAKELKLSALGLTARSGDDPTITGLSVDSRNVRPGHLFAAMPGLQVHGAEFVEFALRMGAAAILTDRLGAKIAASHLAQSNAALVLAEDPRQTLAYAAALWFGRQPEIGVPVTAPNGQPSVATFLRPH